MVNLKELQKKVREFVDERAWRKFQTTKELAIDTSVEANELLELFLWKNENELEEEIISGKTKL
jgi:NTP pyrophosphatase (non-canonical NTP hydrolase)